MYIYDNTHTVTSAHEDLLRACVQCAVVCVRSNQSTRRIHQSGKCTLYLYNNKYMRTCACLNTNSDRIPIQLIKMHVNGDGGGDFNDNDDNDGFCGYTRYFRHHRRRLFSAEETRLRACTFTTCRITRILCTYLCQSIVNCTFYVNVENTDWSSMYSLRRVK